MLCCFAGPTSCCPYLDVGGLLVRPTCRRSGKAATVRLPDSTSSHFASWRSLSGQPGIARTLTTRGHISIYGFDGAQGPSLVTMSLPNRPLGSHLKHTSFGGVQSQSGQSALLMARINEKKAELEQLKQLKDLSASLATQMEALQEKLSTLSDGTEGKVDPNFGKQKNRR